MVAHFLEIGDLSKLGKFIKFSMIFMIDFWQAADIHLVVYLANCYDIIFDYVVANFFKNFRHEDYFSSI